MLLELTALVGAIVLVVLVQLLRTMLAWPFPRFSARWLTAAPPKLLDGWFAELERQLSELGFEAPRWLQVERADGEPDLMPVRVLFEHSSGHGTAWAAPPLNARHPHRPSLYFASRLADGRTAVSQPFDCYFAATQGGSLIARTAAEPTLASQWQAHRAWVESLGGSIAERAADAAPQQLVEMSEQQRQWLLQQGRLQALTADLALPRIGFALALLRSYLRQPKPPADPRPVPAERIALLARVQQTVRQRTPPKQVQWGLFGASVALFMLAGALLWDVEAALAILIVVLIHELGHFLAMRAFGYRNVHILALPLVGGVAIGEDAEPAATRRAWMSLMGPLPGIVIGWALLAVALFGGLGWTDGWLLPLATVFLVINYLNVLPMPPLDGAHVVEALLPLRWARAQTVFLAVAAMLGGWLAWQLDFVLLTMLALLQLPALPMQWRLHGMERALALDPELPRLQRNLRLLRVLQAMEQALGPATDANKRIQLALRVQSRLECRPMGPLARVSTALVYVALLAVPVAGLMIYAGTSGDFARERESAARWEADHARLRAEAAAMDLADLVDALSDPGRPAAASDEVIRTTEQRLGQALPDELHAFYALADGLPAAGIAPLAEIARAADGGSGDRLPGTGTISLTQHDGTVIDIGVDALGSAWAIGGDDESQLLYLPQPDPHLPDIRLVRLQHGVGTAYPGLQSMLARHWAMQRARRARSARLDASRDRLTAEWADKPVDALLDAWEPPGIVARWLVEGLAWGEPADEQALDAAARRLGTPLPDELRAVLARYDGFPPLQLLPSREIASWAEIAEQVDENWLANLATPSEDPDAVIVDAALLSGCRVIGGASFERVDGQRRRFPRLLWCPERAQPWLDLGERRTYARLRDWVAPLAVRAAAAREAAW